MLERCVNQAAGLQRLASQSTPRVMAMASHGSQQGELPLLWSLCCTLVEFGYPVAVLDASTPESAANPGLLQLLDDADWRADAQGAPLAWTVIPAALGLQRLGARPPGPGPALSPLGGLLERFGVVIIYADADVLSRLLPDSGIAPLLTVAPVKMSPVTAYRALKQMLLSAKLRPTIAYLECAPDSTAALAKPSPMNNLQECAMTFLDYRLDSMAVRVLAPQDGRSDDVRRLALRLLENAMPLHRNQFVGSH